MTYTWWHSGYDRRCHAFESAQTAVADRVFYEAVCEHSVPVERLEREQHGHLCVPCLVKVGAALPDDGPGGWRG
ncbi:hypothetical protein [Umezawaea tangerina]|uniref:Uncharacterized protein n=1 Tax=Umezawaea tangerina TaxID=84725 RepID=A0A2T0TM06_9PSEU|nr:hypothetical protein [Umezawaea tangerina]PRY46693.1 hypothetical protein CLV43_101973 [Umezawaea tangerina]